MRYVYWAIPGLLAGRPGPDEIPWDLHELRRRGFGAILSLHAAEIDPAEIARHGFAHRLVLLPDSVPPTPEDVTVYRQRVPEALAFIATHVGQGVPALLHCHAGRDRTGVVLACYLCLEGRLAPTEAVSRLRRARPSVLTAQGYQELAGRLVAELAAEE